MPTYRVTVVFGQATDGASETYWTTNDSATQTASNIQQLLTLRSRLLNTFQYFQGVRVSIEGQRRSSQLIKPPGAERFFDTNVGVSCPATGTLSPLTEDGTPDQFRAVLQQKFRFGTNRFANRYLSGIPDAISLTEPATFTRNAATGWWSNLDAFRKFLTSGNWRLRAQDLPPAITVYSVVGVTAQAAAPFLLGVTIAPVGPPPTLTMGQKIALQGFRPAKHVRASTLNGIWYVASTEAAGGGLLTVYLRNSAGIDPTKQNFTDKTILRPVTYSFPSITDIITQQVCTHKRGKPSLAPRGRRLTRLSLDP